MRSIGLVGHKCGMTRIFTEDGTSIPVTVIMVEPNRITQIKNLEKEGYCAVQVTTGACKSHKVNKPLAGHYAKANVIAGRGLWEFKVSPEELSQFKVRIDDKLNRVKNNQGFAGDNDIDDLIGYLILLKIAIDKEGTKGV